MAGSKMLPVQPWPKKELLPCSVEVVLVDNLASKSRSTTRRGRRCLVQAPFRRRSQPISFVAVSAVHSPCSSTGSNEMPRSSSPARWTDATNLELLELGAAFASQKAGATPLTPTYIHWIAIMSAKHGEIYTVKQMRSRMQRFRKDYILFTCLKNDLGLGWDEEQQTFKCPKWKWEDYCKKDKNYRDMWNGLPHYDLLHAIFGGSLATGEFAVLSTDLYLRQAQDGVEFDSSGDDKQDAMTMETGPRSGDKRASSSRARKGKQKKGSTRAEYECNMSALASVLVSRLDTNVSSAHSRQSGPRDVSMDQVVDIVGSLPDLTEQQIIGAFEFFRVNPDAMPIFLRMQPHFRSGYIRFVVP